MSSVFDGPIVVDDPEAAKKLMEIIMSDEPVEPLPHDPFFRDSLKRGEQLMQIACKAIEDAFFFGRGTAYIG